MHRLVEDVEQRILLTGGLNFDLSGNFEAFDESQYGQDTAFLGFGYEGALSDAPTNSAGDPQADPKFFGFEFDTGDIQKTAIAEDPFFGTKWGGEFRADLSGKLGVEVGAYVNTGSISVDYAGSGSLEIPEVTSLGSLPVSSFFSFDDAEFSTQPIFPGLFVDIIAEVDGGLGATACVGGCIDIDIPLDVEFEQELIAFNRNNDRELRLAGISVGEQAPGGGDYTFENNKSGQQAGQSGSSSGSGISSGFYVDFGPDESELIGNEISFGVGLGAKNIVALNREAGSLTVTVPDYSLTDSSPAAGGILTANTSDLDRLEDGTHPTQLARLDLDLPTLASFPLSGEFELSLGPAALSGQLFSYILEASLGLDQDIKVVPEYYLDLDLSSPASVSIDGSPYALRNTIRVLPGTDIDILYSGEPIVVTPSFNFGVRVDNTLDLGVDLGGYLEMLALGFDVAGTEIFDLGPLLGRDETGSTFIENEPIARLFGGSFRLNNESPLNDFNKVGTPYTIGGSFTFDGDSAANPIFGTQGTNNASVYQHSVAQGEARPVTKRVANNEGEGYADQQLVSTGRVGETQAQSDLKGTVATSVAKETRLLEPGSATSPGGANASISLAAYRDPIGERHEGHPDVNATDPNLSDAHLNDAGEISREIAENNFKQWVALNHYFEEEGLPLIPRSDLVLGGWTPIGVLFDEVNLLNDQGNTIHKYQSYETLEFVNPLSSTPLVTVTHTIDRVNYIDHIDDPRPTGQGASRGAHAYFWSGKGISQERTENFSRQTLFGSGIEFSDVLERTSGTLQSPWLGYRGEFDAATDTYLGLTANTLDDRVVRYFEEGNAPITTSETLGSVGPGLDRSIWAAANLIGSEVATEIVFEATAGQFESITFPTFSSTATPDIAVRERDIVYGVSPQSVTLLNNAEFTVEAFIDGSWSSVQTVSAGDTLMLGAGLYSDSGADQLRITITDPTGATSAADVAVSMQQLIVGLTFADTGVRYFSQGDVRFDGSFTATPITSQTAEIEAPPQPAELLSTENQPLEVDSFGADLPVFDENGQPTNVLASEALNVVFDVNSNLADFADTIETGFERYSVDVPLTIPDGGTVTSSLVIDSDFEISDLDVRLNVVHERVSDLEVTLISPAGTRVKLASQVGGEGDNFVQTKFDDEATRDDGTSRSINAAPSAAPFSGRYVPAEMLSSFDGENTRGTWQLEIRDLRTGVEGRLTRWSILPKVQRTANPQQITELRETAAGGSTVQGSNVAHPDAVEGASAANPLVAQDATADPLQILLTSWNVESEFVDLVLDGMVIASTAAGTPNRSLADLFLPGGALDGLVDASDPDAAVAAIEQLKNDGRLVQTTRTGQVGVSDFVYVQTPDSSGYEYTAPAGTLISEFAIDGDFGTSPLLGDTWDLYVSDGDGGFTFFRSVNCLQSVTLPGSGVTAVRLYARKLAEQFVSNTLNQNSLSLNIVAGFKLTGTPTDAVPILAAASLGARTESVANIDVSAGNEANDGTADSFRLLRNGANVDVYINGTLTESVATATTDALNVVGSEDNDTLTVDLAGGPIGIPVSFHGGSGASIDKVTVTGGIPQQFEHTFANEQSGTLTIDSSELSYHRVDRIVDNTAIYHVNEGEQVELNHVNFDVDREATSGIETDLSYVDGQFTADVENAVFDANGLDGPSSATVAVRITNGNARSIPVISVVTVANVAPTINAGDDITIVEGSMITLTPTFNGRAAGATFNDQGTSDTHEATITWGDGTPTESAIVFANPVSGGPGIVGGLNGEIHGSHTFADDGVYTVTISVRDDDMGTDQWVSDTFVVTVVNSLPELDAGPDITVDEGKSFSLSPATFTDAGFDFAPAASTEDFEAFIDWGDGTVQPLADLLLTDNNDGGPGSFTTGTIDASHVYADNGSYVVTVRLKDDDMEIGDWVTDTFVATVLNADPAIAADTLTNSAAGFGTNADEIVTVSVDFADFGFDFQPTATQEEFVLSSIDWGDGTVSSGSELIVDRTVGSAGVPTTATLLGTHEYATGGVYEVTLTVRDDDGGVDQVTTFVQITGVGIVDGTLYAIGSNSSDTVTITVDDRRDVVRVQSRIGRRSWFQRGRFAYDVFPIDSIDEIVVRLGDGNDSVKVLNTGWPFFRRQSTAFPITVEGGNGNYTIATGSGPAEISVGNGNHWIQTGSGDDVVSTGDGRSYVFTFGGNDTVMTGDGNDVIHSGDGDDFVSAGGGADSVFAGFGNDLIQGGAGNDFIDAGFGNDVAIGGTGRDFIRGSAGEDLIIGGSILPTVALDSLFADWTSNAAFADRIELLRTGSGATGEDFLAAVEAGADSDRDIIDGGSDRDWLLATSTGNARDYMWRRRHDVVG